MLLLKYLVATCLLALTVGAANANTIKTFDVDASFGHALVSFYHTPTTLTGTLTVDVTAGVVTGSNLLVPGFSVFSNIAYSYEQFVGLWQIIISNSAGNVLNFAFVPTPAPSSGQLVNLISGVIGGGDLYVGCTPCSTPEMPNWPLPVEEYFGGNSLRGSITSEVAQTPLPAALPLYATGLGVMGWLARRRKHKNAAALAAA
jgi:hypothetical protein